MSFRQILTPNQIEVVFFFEKEKTGGGGTLFRSILTPFNSF